MLDQEVKDHPSGMKDSIPFQHVNWGMLIKLANKLDPDNVVGGNNWRMLAEKLGYTNEHIQVFEANTAQHGRNTIKVLQDYAQKQGSTVNEVYKALREINRPDALKELKDGLPDIEKSYRESLQKKHRHKDIQENEYICTTCEEMPYQDSYLQSFPLGHRKYGMMPSKHQISMSPGNKQHYQRHKSVELSTMVDGMNNRHPGYEHPSPEFKRQRSMPIPDSMIVHGRENLSQYYHDLEPMDYSPSIREDPVPPALAMMRGMQRYEAHSSMMTTHNKDMDVLFRQPYAHSRQSDRPGLKLDIPSAVEAYARQRSGDFCSPSPTPTSPAPATPLLHLEKLAKERKFQPEEAYNDLMRLKHQEELLQCKAGHLQHLDNHNHIRDKSAIIGLQHAHLAPNHKPAAEKLANHHSDELVGRQKSSEPPNTFPLRVKSNSCSSSSSSTMSYSAQLVKSASLPNNMKPAEFRKAFRHIKVFVTYAADDKKHTQRVLSLCKCLEKNGFTCCVDIFHRKLHVDERANWYQKRFEEADFILAIMSPKYLREADSCEMDNDADDSDSMDSDGENDRDDQPHRLHTKHIYRLMYDEYVQTGQRCTRFVPLLFQGMQHDLIPRWMLHAYNKLVYVWPKQYKDLLWMLTKPENRVPEHVAPSIKSLNNGTECQDTNNSSEVNLESE